MGTGYRQGDGPPVYQDRPSLVVLGIGILICLVFAWFLSGGV